MITEMILQTAIVLKLCCHRMTEVSHTCDQSLNIWNLTSSYDLRDKSSEFEGQVLRALEAFEDLRDRKSKIVPEEVKDKLRIS